jgi:hypothetical protein
MALKKRNFISGKVSLNETPHINYAALSGLKHQNYALGSKTQEQSTLRVENNKLGSKSIQSDFERIRS